MGQFRFRYSIPLNFLCSWWNPTWAVWIRIKHVISTEGQGEMSSLTFQIPFSNSTLHIFWVAHSAIWGHKQIVEGAWAGLICHHKSNCLQPHRLDMWLTGQPHHVLLCLILLSSFGNFSLPEVTAKSALHSWHMSWDQISSLSPELWQNVIIYIYIYISRQDNWGNISGFNSALIIVSTEKPKHSVHCNPAIWDVQQMLICLALAFHCVFLLMTVLTLIDLSNAQYERENHSKTGTKLLFVAFCNAFQMIFK